MFLARRLADPIPAPVTADPPPGYLRDRFDAGGQLHPAQVLIYNGAGKPERVLTSYVLRPAAD